MSKEKQIEEVAKVIKSSLEGLGSGNFNFTGDEFSIMLAKAIYAAGYRKQSEPFSCGHEKGGEWISVDERLPEKSGDYLTYHNGVFGTLMYSAKHRLFNATDGLSEERCLKYNVKVSHWMPLPEAPKMRKEDEGK